MLPLVWCPLACSKPCCEVLYRMPDSTTSPAVTPSAEVVAAVVAASGSGATAVATTSDGTLVSPDDPVAGVPSVGTAAAAVSALVLVLVLVMDVRGSATGCGGLGGRSGSV